MQATKVLDARGLSCPMPIVRTKKAMDTLQSGDILEVQTTDSGSVNDLTSWTKSTGHQMLDSKENDGVYVFWIQKA
ncbi:sulfurtransferase TusA family protein [Hazenella coriacea]|uniref:TusA-related sulfurtransferase n=1 Tax=Hazenella coriacea TaxID=1179467 RepID=A0A4R3LH44_9BACL|nr:sulfurtransferase TusA family protein [Hazenella coriacea]TCS96836.1 TusA-related sulfurtransferase [Hazenella coriacea]